MNSNGGINKNGSTTSHNLVNNSNGVRPAISLASGTIVSSGDGSINNPYIISEEYKELTNNITNPKTGNKIIILISLIFLILSITIIFVRKKGRV